MQRRKHTSTRRRAVVANRAHCSSGKRTLASAEHASGRATCSSTTDSQQKSHNVSKESPLWKFAYVGLITMLVLGPRLVAHGYYWARLRSGLTRPVVPLEVERPLLIVGSLASGTVQMAEELRKLGIEVGLGTSDAMRHFARDGTVSWAHGIRFFPVPPSPPGERPRAPDVPMLCRQLRLGVFHSTMFKPAPECSGRIGAWDRCWANECAYVARHEYGCALARRGEADQAGAEVTSGTNSSTCFTPFARTLLQVRHPLRTIASLVAAAGPGCSEAGAQLSLIEALFPEAPWHRMVSCVEKFAWFWLLYNQAVLPQVDGWYRVESTPPCRVATLAGLGSRPAVLQRCARRRFGEGPGHGEEHGHANRKNTQGLRLAWTDLQPFGNDLQHRVWQLAAVLGYD